MTIKGYRTAGLLGMVLVYCLAVILWGAVRQPLAPVEARTVFMGRELLGSWWAGGLVDPGTKALMQGNLGSVAISPVILAIADGAGGIFGARFVCGLAGLLLVVLVYMLGNTSRYGGRGLLAASTFVFLGLPVQIISSAGSDVFAAVFLGGSLLCVEQPSRDRRRMLLGGLLLAFAVITNYLALLFLPSFFLLVLLRRRSWKETSFFALPPIVLLALYGYFAVLSDWPAFARNLLFHHNFPAVLSAATFGYVFNWLTMPLLLTTVGIFHEEGGRNSFFMLLFAAPAFLVQFVSIDVNDVHTVVFFAMILLAPASALGIAQMVAIFTANNSMAFARPFFTTAILVIIWVFGVQQMKELIRERPDLSPAVAFLSDRGTPLTVFVDSDYGSPEYVYRYYLDEKSPPAKVVAVVRADDKEREEMVRRMAPRYVVVDGHHSARSFNEACRDYMQQGFAVAATFKMPLVSGDSIIRIFQKGAL